MGLREIAYALGIIMLAVYTAIKERREWSAKKKGLSSNPTRCEEHAKAITQLQKDVEYIREKIEDMR